MGNVMEDLVANKVYKINKKIDGNKPGTKVVFKWWSRNGWAIVSPVGEPDMQSMLNVKREELEDVT